MDFVGLLLCESLFFVVDFLKKYGLRECVKVIVLGKLIVLLKVVWVLVLGVDFIVLVCGYMFLFGCI